MAQTFTNKMETKIRKRQIQTWPSLSVNGQNPTGQNPTRQNPIEQNPTQIKTHFKNTMWLVMFSKFIKLYLADFASVTLTRATVMGFVRFR